MSELSIDLKKVFNFEPDKVFYCDLAIIEEGLKISPSCQHVRLKIMCMDLLLNGHKAKSDFQKGGE